MNVADTMFWNRISEFFSPTMGRFRDGLKSIIPRIKGPFIPKKAIHKEKLNRTQKKNKQEYLKHFQAQTSALNIVKTTQHSDGQLIDWIPIESQGEIAEAPPIPERVNLDSPERHGLRPKAELEFDGAEVGPEGTVPVPRQNIELLDFNKTLHERLSKQAPPIDGSNGISTSAANHWYASSAQSVSNNGGSGIFSMFKPYMGSSSDFSLIQSAVIRSNVPMPYNQSVTGPQTVEAGWINWPVQGAQPHLFTFFTTNVSSSIPSCTTFI